VVAVSTDTVAAAFFVRSTMLVASTWYVPVVVAVKTPASVTEAPVGSWIDQFTPAVLAAPSTVAARVVGLLVSTETVAGVTVTFEYRLMTRNPLSCAVVQTSPASAPRSLGKLGLEVAQSYRRTKVGGLTLLAYCDPGSTLAPWACGLKYATSMMFAGSWMSRTAGRPRSSCRRGSGVVHVVHVAVVTGWANHRNRVAPPSGNASELIGAVAMAARLPVRHTAGSPGNRRVDRVSDVDQARNPLADLPGAGRHATASLVRKMTYFLPAMRITSAAARRGFRHPR
jgi:hypothetical protein